MSYTPPLGNAADFTWAGAASYAPPLGNAASFSFVEGPAAEGVAGYAAAGGVLGTPAVVGLHALVARAALAGVLGTPAAYGAPVVVAGAAAPSPLAPAAVRAWHDFTGALGDVATHYVMDLVTPAGPVRVPVASWQSVQRIGAASYLQCVVPAAGGFVAAIGEALEMVISRRAVAPDGTAVEYEMARAPMGTARFDRRPGQITCNLAAFGAAPAPDAAAPARPVRYVRSDAAGADGRRVRCAVDWFLRPGGRATLPGGGEMTVSSVGHFVTAAAGAVDEFMEIG